MRKLEFTSPNGRKFLVDGKWTRDIRAVSLELYGATVFQLARGYREYAVLEADGTPILSFPHVYKAIRWCGEEIDRRVAA